MPIAFAMWFGSGQPKTQIQEANRHLSALTEKVAELEEKVRIKNEELKKKEDDFTIAMQEVQERRALELKELNNLIYQQNLKLQRLESDLSKRDSELTVLRKRGRMLDEILRYKATLGKLTITMEQAEQFARLTAGARNYPHPTDMDGVNTEPAPLMIRDVSFIDHEEQNGVDSTERGNKRNVALADTPSGPTLVQLSQKELPSV